MLGAERRLWSVEGFRQLGGLLALNFGGPSLAGRPRQVAFAVRVVPGPLLRRHRGALCGRLLRPLIEELQLGFRFSNGARAGALGQYRQTIPIACRRAPAMKSAFAVLHRRLFALQARLLSGRIASRQQSPRGV